MTQDARHKDAVRRPYPEPSALTAPFWQGANQHSLLYQTSGFSTPPIFPPQAFAPHSLRQDLDFAKSAGRGTVYSYTVIYRPQTPAFEAPYVVAIIELDEGYMMLSNIENVSPDDVRIGMRVRVDFIEVQASKWLPIFVPEEEVR
jgi:uncharacterized protein